MPHLKSLFDRNGYDTIQDWKDYTRLQYGRSGLVMNSKNPEQSYRTAFLRHLEIIILLVVKEQRLKKLKSMHLRICRKSSHVLMSIMFHADGI